MAFSFLKSEPHSQKPQTYSLIVGLLLTLGVGTMIMIHRRKWQSVISGSEYARYLPWIEAQVKHETADYTSRLAREDNNLFGMHVPRKRKFFGKPGRPSPDGGTYAKYDSQRDSARDYLELLRYNSFPKNLTTLSEFVQELKNDGYYTDTVENYYNGLKRFL